MDELLQEFISETVENLGILDQQLLDLEASPNNDELIRSIFRILHTIKGTCGFLGLTRMEKVAHSSETVLGKMRDHELGFSPEIGSALFDALDRLKAIVDVVLSGGDVQDITQDQPLIDTLLAFVDAQPQADELQALFDATPGPLEIPIPEEIVAVDDLQALFDSTPGPQENVSAPILSEQDLQALFDATPVETVITDLTKASKNPIHPPETQKTDVAAIASTANAPIVATESIRVNLDVLDNLITLVSELVLTRNQLLQLLRNSPNQTFDMALSRLSYITTELQEEVMKTRMQPIENAWTKFPRLIRDLSKELKKKITLKQEGGNTEVDRQVLELIKDPLTHMVRNSCDHGIEMPDDRIQKGKNEEGSILLKAYHEGGHIVMEVSDDGRGLDPVKLAKKCVEKGLFTELEVANMSDPQIQNVIFLPGFSTAAAVTSVSGRGVGMDVVKSNIEKLGGSIDMQSTPGHGTQFVIKIPLTLTIISAIILECGGERFAIPQISVTELHRIGGRSQYYIEFVNDMPIMRLRNQLLPLLFLSKHLRMSHESKEEMRAYEKYVVVVHIGNSAFGIVVDNIYDTQEIVVKPLAKIIENIKIFSGSTILGDGSIVMILDPNVLSSIVSLSHSTQVSQINKNKRLSKINNENTLLLIFKSENHFYSLPLSLISRIGEVDHDEIDLINGVLMTQYQNYLLPLLMFDGSNNLPKRNGDAEHKIPVLIFSDHNRVIGLLVDEIITIRDEKIDIQVSSKSNGILGTSLMDGETVSIIDIEYHLKRIYPDWFDQVEAERSTLKNKMRVLFIDDSQFFRHLMTPVINLAGYEVVTAVDGENALDIIQNDQDFDVIISDIEMPKIDGFELCKRLRSITKFQDPFPVIALSSRVSELDVKLSRDVGFSEHISKTEQKKIIQSLQRIKREEFEKRQR
ncbi:MAG: Sensor histidine kinase RcsC [Holosporales bacterium]